MAGKRKQIEKQPKEDKSAPKAETNTEEIGVFSSTFNEKLEHFSTLTKEILTVKA